MLALFILLCVGVVSAVCVILFVCITKNNADTLLNTKLAKLRENRPPRKPSSSTLSAVLYINLKNRLDRRKRWRMLFDKRNFHQTHKFTE